MEQSDKFDKDRIIARDKVSDLLLLRRSKKDSLMQLDRLICEGLDHIKGLPDRWYIRHPNKIVIDYLNKKYNKNIDYDSVIHTGVGYGERYGEFVMIPPDTEYGWELYNNEFEHIYTKLKLNGVNI